MDIESFKVLSTILALEEFTGKRVAEYAGVEYSRVQELLRNSPHLYSKEDAEVFRIRDGARAQIKEELEGVDETEVVYYLSQMPGMSWIVDGDPALPLDFAESLLKNHLGEAAFPEEYEQILEMIKVELSSSSRMIKRHMYTASHGALKIWQERRQFLSGLVDRISRKELLPEEASREIEGAQQTPVSRCLF